MTAAPRELLIDAQGRLMQRSQGDLATPDCPECCGPLAVVRADLCATTPGYASRHPKRIYIDCPSGGYFCLDPADKRLLKYLGNGFCYRPNYSSAGPAVCEPMPEPGADDVYVGPAETAVSCLPPASTCNTPVCKQACDEPPACCEAGSPGRADFAGCNSGPCDCGQKWMVLWWAHAVETHYDLDNGGVVFQRTTRDGAGFALWTSGHGVAGDCSPAALCRLTGGGTHTTVEGVGASESWLAYNPDAGCVGGASRSHDCAGAWAAADCHFREIGSALQGHGCSWSAGVACTAVADGWHEQWDADLRCDGFSFERSEWDRAKDYGCQISYTKQITASATLTRVVDCDGARPGGGRPGVWELL